jgi:hypothetical protein
MTNYFPFVFEISRGKLPWDSGNPLTCSSADHNNFEKLVLDGLNSGKSKRMTMARKKRIYKQALGS